MKGDRDSFARGGFWRPADRSGRAASLRAARDQAAYDHQPKRGVIARLINRKDSRS
ncbi:hypothetical protein ACWDTP_38595 [Mycobacterium sp. NPDC003449]